MSVTNTTIKAEAFNRSIEAALKDPPNLKESIERIKHSLHNLPAGKLYTSDRKKEVIFYTKEEGHHKYLSKKSELIHPLARKSYLTILLKILELTGATKARDIQKRQALISKLQELISTYERGNLEIAKIVLTSRQYKWLIGSFEQKKIDRTKSHKTASGVYVRSNSEKDIINKCEEWAVPVHYEERQYIKVATLVNKLKEELAEMGLVSGQLYSYRNGGTTWNVPAELGSMNARGSIWRSYYPPTGTLKIFNDFKIMFADGTLFIWEHEGMMELFTYRFNASERTAIMKYTGVVDQNHLLETYESDVDTPEKIIDIIEKYILPRIWF